MEEAKIQFIVELNREISYHQRVKVEIKLVKPLADADYKVVQKVLDSLNKIADEYLDEETKVNKED